MDMVFDKTLHSKSVKVKHLRQLSFYFIYKLLIYKDLTRACDSNFWDQFLPVCWKIPHDVGISHMRKADFPTLFSRICFHSILFFAFSWEGRFFGGNFCGWPGNRSYQIVANEKRFFD